MIDKIVRSLRAELGIAAEPRQLATIVEPLLVREIGPTDAPDRLKSVTASVHKRLLVIRRSCHEGETDCWFEFNSMSTEYIQGPCYSEPAESPERKQAKRNRMAMVPMRTALEALTFDQFEVVSAALLYVLGVRDAKKTKHSRDQGIDFFGRLVVADLRSVDSPFFGFTHQLKFWLIGQAKHYVRGAVRAPEIRNLVGSVLLARHKEYASTSELMKLLPLRSCDPAFTLVFTTGRFTRDAQRLAQNSGVVIQDIEDIAKFLADRGVNVAGPTADEAAAELAAWAENIVA